MLLFIYVWNSRHYSPLRVSCPPQIEAHPKTVAKRIWNRIRTESETPTISSLHQVEAEKLLHYRRRSHQSNPDGPKSSLRVSLWSTTLKLPLLRNWNGKWCKERTTAKKIHFGLKKLFYRLIGIIKMLRKSVLYEPFFLSREYLSLRFTGRLVSNSLKQLYIIWFVHTRHSDRTRHVRHV